MGNVFKNYQKIVEKMMKTMGKVFKSEFKMWLENGLFFLKKIVMESQGEKVECKIGWGKWVNNQVQNMVKQIW